MKKNISLLIVVIFAASTSFAAPTASSTSVPQNIKLELVDSFVGEVVDWQEYKVIESVEMFNEFYSSLPAEDQQALDKQIEASAQFNKSSRRCKDLRGGLLLTLASSAFVSPLLFIPGVVIVAILYPGAFVIDKLNGCGSPLD